MKTIKQIADEIGVSKDKIKYRVKKLPTKWVKNERGITYITPEGEREICLLVGKKVGKNDDFTHLNYPPSGELPTKLPTLPTKLPTKLPTLPTENERELNNQFNQNSTDIQPMIDVLKTTIDTLQKQLEIKDQQIAQLQQELAEERKHSREQAEKITVLADQSQRLQMAQISSTSEVSDVSETTSKSSKKHWWQRIKKDPV